MPVDIFDAPSEPSYAKHPSHSFAFCDGKASSSRKSSRQSRRQKQSFAVDTTVPSSGLDFDDDRVELYTGPRPNASIRQKAGVGGGQQQHHAPPRQQPRHRYNSASFSQWDDGGVASDNSILASFPFHASSFHKDNNDDTTDVYDYDINEIDLNKYVTPPPRQPIPTKSSRANSNNHRGNLSAGSCRGSRTAVDDDDIFDRPPSRQCHAFPTHLVDQVSDDDNDDFDHPPEKGRRPAPLKRRPPSRHKHLSASQKHIHDTFPGSCEINEQSLEDTIHRFRTRRDMRRIQSHDPTRDGFDPVDETVPMPFRIEVTTNNNPRNNSNQSNASSHSRRYRTPSAAAPPSAAYDEMRRTLQSRAEDPVVVKTSALDRRHSSMLQRGGSIHGPPQWLKDEPHPFFENTLAAQLPEWLVATTSSAGGDGGPETNSEGVNTATTDDLKLDDFNFSATTTPPAPPESSSLRTSLGVDFLSLFAQS
ncbi:hypothetical protein H257_10177 [Aphanomyces astaci]|uniref:Uncharacterized protein n=1 Tax=Aphanomyces astaci TaxID=112090 RepID=W4G942_APHAT|nr:hypothetical protein H257_10177 [Aphanomyces astaci]ETV75811.1 hypothetical protein H257_10177 [Aphanomyces astaci]|eukprot:XP_009834942.1 hypothetical protein H257_10177 [Aphanomyces astaci]